MTTAVAKTIHLSYTAPSLPTPLIRRPILVSAISQLFDSSFATVCVEGRPGYGKTTLLREFAEFSSDPCFSLFLREGSRHSYDPVLARADLTNQLHWHLDSKRLPDEHEPTDIEFHSLLRRCTRNLSRHNSTAYFIVDGLHNIPRDDSALLQAILSLLPFGTQPFRFIFSTDSSQDIFRYHRTIKVKPFVLMAFTSHETDEFLSDVIPLKSLRLDHHNALGGVPSLLASTRRQILTSSNTSDSRSLSLPAEIDAFLDAEWNLLAPLSAIAQTAVSFLVAYGRPMSTAQLSLYTNYKAEELETALSNLSFLSLSSHHGGWEFASEPFRQFVGKKLKGAIKEATEQIATRLLQYPDSDESLDLLPQYLQRIGDANKILEWFDEYRVAKVLLGSRSPAWTEPILRNAISLSHDSGNDRALTTYSILRSVIPQITNVTGIENEIRARCTLGDFDGALSIVHSAQLLTQRLRLLAVLVDAGSSEPGVQVQPLKDEIHDLVQQLDLDYVQEDEAIDIAIDLYPVNQELALRVLKGAIKDEDGKGSLDVAIARITFAALRSHLLSEKMLDLDNTGPKPSNVSVDERIQWFFYTTQRTLRAKTALEVLNLTEEIDRVSERLFIMRKWIDQHRTRSDVLVLVERAINDAISTPDFAPTATFYREVLSPLPYAPACATRSRIIAIVEAQRPIIKAKGPTIDDIRVQLTLASCECQHDEWDRAAGRLEELYLVSIDPIQDLETLTACLGWCIAFLVKHDSDKMLDMHTEFRALVEREFNKAISEIFQNCADQYKIIEKTIEPLSQFLPRRALEICSRLNTESRRTDAILEVISVHCDNRDETVEFDVLFQALASLPIGPELDDALTRVGGAIVNDIESERGHTTQTQKWLSAMGRCTSAEDRCAGLALVSDALAKVEGDESFRNGVSEELRVAFDSIKNPRSRYSVGCKLIFLLHKSCPVLANEIFVSFSENGRVSRLAENVEQGGYFVVDLLAKASCALAKANLLVNGDVQRICTTVSAIPDILLRVRLFARLAFSFWREGENAHFVTIVNSQIWPELADLENGDKELLYSAWAAAYGVAWLENRDRARAAIEQYPRRAKHPCVRNLCFSLLYKLPIGEPFDGRGRPTPASLSFGDIQNLLILCQELDEDHAVFWVLEGIADMLCDRSLPAQLTRDQKAEISRLMGDVALESVPSLDGVQHLGWQIICRAQALRVLRSRKEQWHNLISEAEKIDNSADKVFVLTFLAAYLPNNMREIRESLFAAAEVNTEALKSLEDRYNRFETLAMKSMDFDRQVATRAMEMAFRTVTVVDDSRSVSKERRLVDLAYSVDPELPMRMALLYDDDPAREEYRVRAQEQIDRQELKRALGDVRKDIEWRERQNDRNLAVAAWQSLAGLNAGRTIAVDMNRVREMLVCASNYPLETSYPMYSWVLSNVMEKYADTAQATQYIRELFEGLVRGSKFFFLVAGADSDLDVNPEWHQRDDEDVHVVIKPGERPKALEFLRRWIEDNTQEFVTIVDLYFCPDDLWVVRLVMECNPRVDIRIVCGHKLSETSSLDIAGSYRAGWRKLCDQDPPHTEILSVSLVDSGKCPIHDRWILSKAAGARVGTSLNSIGNKLSEISAMDSNELERVQGNVDGYLARRIREEGGERVAYELFELLP